jgi:hypothetical protein
MATARRFVQETGFPVPVYCDNLADSFETAYAPWPTRWVGVLIAPCGSMYTIKNPGKALSLGGPS